METVCDFWLRGEANFVLEISSLGWRWCEHGSSSHSPACRRFWSCQSGSWNVLDSIGDLFVFVVFVLFFSFCQQFQKFGLLFWLWWGVLLVFIRWAWMTLFYPRHPPALSNHKALCGVKKIACSLDGIVTVEECKKIGKKGHATVNDVVLTAGSANMIFYLFLTMNSLFAKFLVPCIHFIFQHLQRILQLQFLTIFVCPMQMYCALATVLAPSRFFFPFARQRNHFSSLRRKFWLQHLGLKSCLRLLLEVSVISFFLFGSLLICFIQLEF